MISSTSSSDHAARLDAVLPAGQRALRSAAPRFDRISTESAAMLRTALAAQPEIRPEVVERARALAADPSYPPRAIMRSIAQQILRSPDLSEDQS